MAGLPVPGVAAAQHGAGAESFDRGTGISRRSTS